MRFVTIVVCGAIVHRCLPVSPLSPIVADCPIHQYLTHHI